MKDPCVRCGHVGKNVLPAMKLGTTAAQNLLCVAVESSMRFSAGDPEAKRTTAILDALWLALRRGDAVALRQLERWATKYIGQGPRTKAENWGCHEAWSDNSVTVRALIAAAERHIADGYPSGLAWDVRRLYPYLARDVDAWDALKEALPELAEASEGDAALFAVRALVAAGMPSSVAHQKFSFLRVARSRSRSKTRPSKRQR